MAKEKGEYLTLDDRCDIEEMLKEGRSFREIAARIGASSTTVPNEVRANRAFAKPKPLSNKAQSRCSRYGERRVVGLCRSCLSGATACKRCGRRRCYDPCGDFSQMTCPKLDWAPFVCTPCPKRSWCVWGKARYTVSKAQAKRDERLALARSGISCDPVGLRQVVVKVRTLLSQGQSLEAIRAAHGKEIPVFARTFCNCIDRGVMGLANIELPKKVSYAPRRKREREALKMDLAGRTYADWLALSEEERLLAVQIGCVKGARRSTKCILSLHFVRLFFQLHILLPAKSQDCVEGALDVVECFSQA